MEERIAELEKAVDLLARCVGDLNNRLTVVTEQLGISFTPVEEPEEGEIIALMEKEGWTWEHARERLIKKKTEEE